MSLSPKAQEVLRVVTVFGGYASSNIIKEFFGFSLTFSNRMLAELSDQKYLKLIINYPKIYQITHKGCVFVSRPNSYLRHRHTPFTIRKKLTVASFLAKNCSPKSLDLILGFSDTRITYLQKRGIADELIPHKLNGDIATLQIEETFILLPPFAPSDGICIVLGDNLESAISTQLRSVVGRYIPLIRSRCLPVSFTAVTESIPRARRFETEYAKIISREINKPKFQGIPINYSYEFVLKKLGDYGVYT